MLLIDPTVSVNASSIFGILQFLGSVDFRSITSFVSTVKLADLSDYMRWFWK